MLTRNCAITRLLNEGDFNVRVTVFDAAKVSGDIKYQIGAWYEIIRDSIGGGVVNSNDYFKIVLEGENISHPFRGIMQGKNIIEIVKTYCPTPAGIRISIAPSSNKKNERVWIFI